MSAMTERKEPQDEQREERKSRRHLVVLCVMAALLVALGALLYAQRGNLAAALLFFSKDSAGISQTLEEKRAIGLARISEYGVVDVVPMTAEQTEAILEGERTVDEVMAEIGATARMLEGGGAVDPDLGRGSASEIINRYVARLYHLQAQVMDTLGQMKRKAVGEYLALPQERQTRARLYQIGIDGFFDCYRLEGKTDVRVRAILADCRRELLAGGLSAGVADDLWRAYQDEKSAEKAYYLDKYVR